MKTPTAQIITHTLLMTALVATTTFALSINTAKPAKGTVCFKKAPQHLVEISIDNDLEITTTKTKEGSVVIKNKIVNQDLKKTKEAAAKTAQDNLDKAKVILIDAQAAADNAKDNENKEVIATAQEAVKTAQKSVDQAKTDLADAQAAI